MHSEDELSSDEAVEVIACDASSQYEVAPRAAVEHRGEVAAGSGEVTPRGEGPGEPKRRGRGRPPKNNAGEDVPSSFRGRRGRGPGSGGGSGRGGGTGGRGGGSGGSGAGGVTLDGRSFIPHLMSVNAGDDVSRRIVRFFQEQTGGVCVVSASGSVSNVKLRQLDDVDTDNTYEGRFEILSLSGCFYHRERAWTGSMSISIAGADGRVLGGGVSGVLRAATPVQVVLGTFSADEVKDQKGKYTKHSDAKPPENSPPPSAAAAPISSAPAPTPSPPLPPSQPLAPAPPSVPEPVAGSSSAPGPGTFTYPQE